MTTSAVAERVDGATRDARVLVVDERGLLADALRIALNERGGLAVPTPVATSDATSAARAAAPDAVVVHVRCDDDLRVLRELRESVTDTPLLVLADADDDFTVRSAAAAGASGYLTTQDDVDTVVTAVHDALAGRRGTAARRLDASPKRAAGPDVALTDREREVLARLVRGHTTEAIADELGVSRHTARTHIQRVLTKLNVHSRLEAAACALRNGLT